MAIYNKIGNNEGEIKLILKTSDILTFMNTLLSEKKQLVCFGAGENLLQCCEFYEKYDFFNKIRCIIDSNKSFFEYKGVTKPIFSLQNFIEISLFKEKTIIFITSVFYPEIYEMLEKEIALENIECYIYPLVAHLPLSIKFPSTSCKIQKIPKKIHSIWFGGKDIPKHLLICMESWEKYCPDYEILHWNESNYDVSKNQYMNESYKRKRYAFVSDCARIDIVYEHGGVYLDNDVELLRPLDDLLYDDAFCGFSTIKTVNFGLGFGAMRKFPIFKEMVQVYENTSFVKADGTLNLTDCGPYQTKVLEQYGLRHENITQLINGMRVYSTDVLSPIDFLGNRSGFTANTFSIHHYASSWWGNDFNLSDRVQRCKEFWSLHFDKGEKND